MATVTMYTKPNCPYCDWAKQLLDNKQIPYQEIRVDTQPDKLTEMINLTGRRTVPQIIINGQPVGGFDDLSALDKAGKLDELLNF